MFATGYYMCATQTIATPAPASETHLRENMSAFSTTTTVHVRGPRENLTRAPSLLLLRSCMAVARLACRQPSEGR
ncbi:unnamed protein product [Sphagnum troendelagicum]